MSETKKVSRMKRKYKAYDSR